MQTCSRRMPAVLAVPLVLAVTAATAVGTALVTAPSAAAAMPAATPAQAAPAADNCPQTAAKEFGWGDPTRRSDFDGTAVPPDWHPYGPEPGHAKKGTRTPEAVTVGGGVMSINGSQDGTTGAVSWHPGQQYGRWEACVRSDKGSGGLNALLLMWPVEENFPVGGEIDWMEISDDARQKTDFFLHYGEDNQQENGSVDHDATQWSAWAMEWTPEKITTYVNGKEWYSTTETDHLPPGAMNMTMQLDYFGDAGGPAAMHMDWANQWALPESKPATLSLAPGAPATGQPDDYPDRKPRPLDGSDPPADTGDDGQDGSGGDGSDKSGSDKKDKGGSDQNGDSGSEQAASAGNTTTGAGGSGTGSRPRVLHPDTASTSAATGAGSRPRTLHPSNSG